MKQGVSAATDNIRFDRFLRFDTQTNDRYEAETSTSRVRGLQRHILIGLIFYNIYNLTSIVLMPDIFWFTVAVRLGVVTTGTFFLVWVLPKLRPDLREWGTALGVLNAIIFPIGFFWLTQAPLGILTFGELSLTIYYANMMLVLRFAPALVFNIATTGIVVLAVLTKQDLTGAMIFAFLVQFVTATTFAAYGNYLVERRRCVDYARALRATLRAEHAEHSGLALQQMSQTDALTGLPNRRYLDERLADWFTSDSNVAVIMIDVDHFKPFNDQLGHPAGDDCLKQVAQAFANVISGPDMFCARFGGEEFTVVMRNTTQFEAARLAQRLLQEVQDLEIAHPGRRDGVNVVTISLGVSTRLDHHESSVEAILRCADEALYSAKRRGRNRFVLFDRRMEQQERLA